MPITDTLYQQGPRCYSEEEEAKSQKHHSVKSIPKADIIEQDEVEQHRCKENSYYEDQYGYMNRSGKRAINRKGLSLDYFDSRGFPCHNVPIFVNSYLKPNATFIGEQQSGVKRYQIKVEFKTVDLLNSMITGFLQILGLTEENPKITTYFRGEIINNPLEKYRRTTSNADSLRDTPVHKYSFLTDNRDDFEYWRMLTGSCTLTDDQFKSRLSKIQNDENHANDCIYMRWKEEFLLPDSRVKHIQGASFEGFYYIALYLSQDSCMAGSISGLYYQNTPDKIQTLNLRFVEDQGISSKFDFV